MKIVLIEDSTVLRENIKDILIFYNFNVLDFETAYQVIDRIVEYEPDLILCDVKLPDMDGFQFLESVRQTNELCATPFIFISAKSERMDIRKGMDLGADDYITKPFTHSELISAINSRLARAKVKNESINESINEDDILKLKILTKTELRVIKLIANNLTSKEIAEQLFISKKTADNHRTNISKKLNLRGKLSLLKFSLNNIDTITNLIN